MKRNRLLIGAATAVVIGFLSLIIVGSYKGGVWVNKRDKLEARIAALQTDFKICQARADINWNAYLVCQNKLEECRERKPLAERLKNMTLQDVITDVQELDQIVKAFVKKQRRQ
jgi:hydroxylamine reductase (hybrid-cluster protein)